MSEKSINLFYKTILKRILDIVCSTIAFFILSPVFIAIGAMVYIKLGHPIIFKQIRPGMNEKLFTMYKFRTMSNQRDINGNYLSDRDRLNSFGEWLRSTSLDELPELFNIIRGEMSLVGPRPQLVKDLVFMTKEQRIRHRVRPGLTGLAQISGRNALEWEEKLQKDQEYIKKQSLGLDLYIIFTTFIKVFQRENITYDGMSTSEDLGDYLLRTGVITENQYKKKVIEANALLQGHT